MKKLFTLIAFLAVFMGAKAEWVEDYKIDYSTKTSFPFYVMGYVPEWVDGIMTDYGADYRYETQENLDGDGDGKWKDGESSVGTAMAGTTEYQKVTGAGPYWHQYIIAADVPMELDGTYTIKALVKSSAAVNANLQFGDWGKLKETQVTIPASSDFQEVEWEVSGCLNAGKGFICIQPGTSTAVIEWKSLTVSHNAKAENPVTWQEWLTSDGQPVIVETTPAAIATWMGNAETPWSDPNTRFDDMDNNYLICAWSKQKGTNLNGDGGSDPFPASIEVDPDDASNHVFVCHGAEATTEGDAAAWDNQFWIESPRSWKGDTPIKIHFRYKASKSGVTTGTQIHFQKPSDYKVWYAIGDVTFTDEWQDFDQTFNMPGDGIGGGNDGEGWSIAFNLNANDKDAIDFYFDDISWQTMKLEEGYFVAGCNKETGVEYDYANAIKFEEHEYDDDYDYVATIGADGWVNEIMISTVRGHDGSFKSNTLKPGNGTIMKSDPENWIEYTASSLAKIKLPAAGKWTIYLDTQMGNMAFEMLEGEEIVEKEPVDIITNTAVITVNATERDYTSDEQEGGTGATWDNQFFITANRVLETGETTVIEFDYVATKDAKVTTQAHAAPGAYRGGGCGDVNFTTTEAHFVGEFVVPSHANADIQSIAFNLSEIKDANDYTFKNFKWYLKDETLDDGKTYENLIDEVGTEKNFSWKVLTGIFDVLNDATTRSDVIYNLSGQRVTEDYKGVVIKNGRKVVVK
jgi:hypothetical protein